MGSSELKMLFMILMDDRWLLWGINSSIYNYNITFSIVTESAETPWTCRMVVLNYNMWVPWKVKEILLIVTIGDLELELERILLEKSDVQETLVKLETVCSSLEQDKKRLQDEVKKVRLFFSYSSSLPL